MTSNRRKALLRFVLPVAVIVLAVIGAGAMVALRPEVDTRPPQIKPPLVRVAAVELEDVELTVISQGTVSPRTESQLVPEVAGRVIWVSPSFAGGRFFEAGEVLLKVDPHDYRQGVIRAGAQVAQAKLRQAQEEAEARVAQKEWEELGGGDADSLTLREPQLEDARAAVAAAEANLETAERNLERAEIRAPYAGRVRKKNVDVGQFVTVGSPVATLYSVDYAETRLPLPDEELAYLDLPLDYRGETQQEPGPQVTLRAEFAGRTHEWQGRIVRTEGEIDPRSRMVHAVARIKDPYGRGENPDRPPLAVGMYVEAEIRGKTARGMAVLPRSALRGRSQVLVVTPENRLEFREVRLLRTTQEQIVVESGLEQGERVCLSPLAAVTNGMRVRVDDESASAGGEAS